MKEKVETYEEAKKVIKDCTEEELVEHNREVYKKRTGLTAAILTSMAVAPGIMAETPVATISLLPSVGLVSLISFMPYRNYLKALASIKNGSFFEGKSEEEIINEANEYIDTYNKVIDQLKEEGMGKK